MKTVLVTLWLTAWLNIATAQTRFMDKNGYASFFSSAPMEDIRAETNRAVSVIDLETGEIVASMLMRSFHFRKSLMEEHFNENYVESHKFPKASFRGKIRNVEELDLSKDGAVTLDISGDITIHGVTRPLTMKAEANVRGGAIEAKAVFPLTVKDFDIDIPRLVIRNIAEVVEVTVSFHYKPMHAESAQ